MRRNVGIQVCWIGRYRHDARLCLTRRAGARACSLPGVLPRPSGGQPPCGAHGGTPGSEPGLMLPGRWRRDAFPRRCAKPAALPVRIPQHVLGRAREYQGRRAIFGALVVLTLAACAVLAGATSLLAVGEWIADAPPHVLEHVGARLDPLSPKWSLPAETTVRRLLGRIDDDALDLAVGLWLADPCNPVEGRPRGLAVDGNCHVEAAQAEARSAARKPERSSRPASVTARPKVSASSARRSQPSSPRTP